MMKISVDDTRENSNSDKPKNPGESWGKVSWKVSGPGGREKKSEFLRR